MSERPTLKVLLNTLPQAGTVRWIGLRPARRAPMRPVAEVELDPASGLIGDRYAGSNGMRQVSLVQHEHLTAIASMLGRELIQEDLRRNLAIDGINLLALKGRRFTIGAALLEYTGPCHPCSRMEETLGRGGYNAVRGHGGIVARVLRGSTIRLGDTVAAS